MTVMCVCSSESVLRVLAPSLWLHVCARRVSLRPRFTRYSSSGVVDFEVVLCWMEDSLKGLCHLHIGGVRPMVHGDVKPFDLLVFNTGDPSRPYRVKLGDLGESTILSDLPYCELRGAPFFMAPEVREGNYYPASDMFSWGITMCCAVVQAMDGVADPLDFYSANRESLVTRAVDIMAGYRPTLAELLSRCYNSVHTARLSASEALEIVYASVHDRVPEPGPTASILDVVGVVEVMESLGIDANGVIDALGSRAGMTLDELRTPGGVSVTNVFKIRKSLPPLSMAVRSAPVCTITFLPCF